MDDTEVAEFVLRCAQREQPNMAMNMSFIPQEQRSRSLVMLSTEPTKKNLTTCFIGTIRKNYTFEMWRQDVEKWKNHFGPDLEYTEIPLLSLVINGKVLDAIDSTDAIPKIETALQAINQLPGTEMVRLVCLGTGHCHFLFQAIAYLLKEWRDPLGSLRSLESKQIQFVTSGDTEERDMSNFCQWLCISSACNVVEFHNTMTYHPFGYCSADYEMKLKSKK
jgi:hypothetical protein